MKKNKFIFTFILLAILSMIFMLLSPIKYKNHQINNQYERINYLNNKDKTYLDFENQYQLQRTLISRYPNKVSKPEDFDDDLDFFKEISKGDRNDMWGIGREIINVNINDLGFSSKTEFLIEYNTLWIDFSYAHNLTNNGNSGWTNGSDGTKINFIDQHLAISLFSNSELLINDIEWFHSKSSSHKIKQSINFKWVDNHNFQLNFNSKASLNYNKGSKYAHAAFAGFKFNEIYLA